MAITITYTFTPNTTALSAEVNANFSLLASRATDKTGDTLTGTINTQSFIPTTSNTYDLGSTSFFYRTGHVKTSLILGQTTANYTLTWANPASARAISFEDPGGTDIITYKAATQTLTNKTLTTPTISSPAISNPTMSGSITGTYNIAGTPTIVTPIFSGTITGVYTLGGTPTISAPVLSGTVTGTYTLGGTPTLPASGLTGTITSATQDLITRVGTITSGVWNAGAVTSSSTVTVASGSKLFIDGGGDTWIYETVANNIDLVAGGTTTLRISASGLHFGANIADAIAAPTIASGFGTSPSITGKGYSFVVTVGTGGVANSGVVNFGTTFAAAPSVSLTYKGSPVVNGILQANVISTTQLTITQSNITNGVALAFTAGQEICVLVRGF